MLLAIQPFRKNIYWTNGLTNSRIYKPECQKILENKQRYIHDSTKLLSGTTKTFDNYQKIKNKHLEQGISTSIVYRLPK